MELPRLHIKLPEQGSEIFTLNPHLKDLKYYNPDSGEYEIVFNNCSDAEVWYIILLFWLDSPYMENPNITERILDCAYKVGWINKYEKRELKTSPMAKLINLEAVATYQSALSFISYQGNIPYTNLSALQMSLHHNNLLMMTPPDPKAEAKNDVHTQRIALQKHTISIMEDVIDYHKKILSQHRDLGEMRDFVKNVSPEKPIAESKIVKATAQRGEDDEVMMEW